MACASTLAQVDRSGLTGTITDPAGKALVQSCITAIETSTQLRREGVANTAARHEISDLPIGDDTVTEDHTGFSTMTFALGQGGIGSIINTINLNTAIVNPITPVGSGTPREI